LPAWSNYQGMLTRHDC